MSKNDINNKQDNNEKDKKIEIEKIRLELKYKDEYPKERLTNLCIQIKNKTECFEDDELYSIFDSLDKYNKGEIDVDLIKYFLYTFRSDINQDLIEPLIENFNKIKFDKLKKEEFVKEMKYGFKEKPTKEISEIEEIFNLLDSDHDGLLGPEDIKNAMSLLGEELFDINRCTTITNLIKSDNEEGITIDTFRKILKNENIY